MPPGASFVVELEPGKVTDVPLNAAVDLGAVDEHPEGEAVDDHAHGLGDGTYTVFVTAEVPLVAAVLSHDAAAQDRALLTVRGVLILRNDRQLVLRAERPPRRTRRRTAGRARTRGRRS